MRKKRVAAGVVALLLLLGVGGAVFYQSRQAVGIPTGAKKTVEYTGHYVFIADDQNDRQWEKIYEEVKQWGDKTGSYVENLAKEFPSEYTRNDYLSMAVSMQADGIIMEGNSDPKTVELVNEAQDAGIPVVTLATDCVGSKRQCFIELGNYNLGREYGRQIIGIATQDTKKVLIMMNKAKDDSSQNLIYTGIRDTLANEGNHLNLELDTEVVGTNAFSSAESIRRKLLGGTELPDILICLSEQDTINTYQILVDYNMVGKIKLIGYYASDAILEGIEKQGIAAAISVDVEQMGMKSVDALNRYRESGHISDYIALEATVVNEHNVKEYQKDGKAD